MQTEPDTSSMPPVDSAPPIAYAKIFPPIGFARVGNSTDPNDGYFIGPEGVCPPAHREEGFSFRDKTGALKRQAARFRVYGFDEHGKLIREITSREARISWTVQLANKKSAWFNFDGAAKALQSLVGTRPIIAEDGTPIRDFRNSHLSGTFQTIPDAPVGRRFRPDDDRKKHGLEIAPAPVAISGDNKRTAPSATQEQYEFRGTFRHCHEVYLGELRTDEEGRLLVLGGHGQSGAVDENGRDIKRERWIRHYANNRDWYDDISDGYVRASVELNDGVTVPVRGDSWVVVAPPDYAPDVENIVTLRDVLEETVVYTGRNGYTAELPPVEHDKTSYQRDILPILRRMLNYRWVSQLGLRGHGFGKPGDFSSMFEKLGDPNNHEVGKVREHIFGLIRKPVHYIPGSTFPSVPGTQAASDQAAATEFALRQATANYMPPLSGDEGDREVGVPKGWLAVTCLQYARLEAWSKGEFVSGGPEADLPPQVLVTRAAFDACCGGAFYPGMELTSIVRHPELYLRDDVFRFRTEIMEPGDLTQYMACPWQADFYECRNDWWPAQRPDDVLTDEDFNEISSSFEEETTGSNTSEFERLLFSRRRWARGIDWRRPRGAFLDAQVFGDPKDVATVAEYAAKRAERFTRLFGLPGDVALTYPERIRSPWRTQYLAQESLDTYSTRYLVIIAPAPEAVFTKSHLGKAWKDFQDRSHQHTVDQLRAGWAAFCIAHPEDAVQISNLYVREVWQAVQREITRIFTEHPDSARPSVEDFIAIFSSESVGAIEDANPQEFLSDSAAYKRLRLAELVAVMQDLTYLAFRRFAGDMGMVEEWHSLGVVTKRDFLLRPRDGTPTPVPIHVEIDRPKYSGRTFREYFHLIMNIEHYSDFAEHSKRLARLFLAQAEEFIERLGLQDPVHPESFVEFSDANYEAKLEQIYEALRQQAAEAAPWADRTTRTDRIRRIIGNSAFNQTDGAWLRYAANAGPADEVRGLLFEVWSDETGNGDPAKHHGNLYTALINQLGFWPPEIRSKAYSEEPRIQLSSFVGALVQLVISQHSEEFFPEILGMTLFLEWEVLSLVPRVKLLDYLGIDSHFWRMHVAIDNATDGHGYAAKRAVKLYLDKVHAESGPDAVQQHWRRVWRGFVAFALGGAEIFGNDAFQADEDIDARYRSTPVDRIAEIMERKKPFGNLNHTGKGLGQFRLNDLFDDPEIFLEELGYSRWITPGDPAASGLIAHLTSFDGPMYKVFDENDLQAWRDWITWLGREGDTESIKRFVPKGEAMLNLVTEFRERAMAAHGHTRFKLEIPGDTARLSIQALFSEPDLKKLLRAIANPENGWVVPGRPEESALLIDMARGDKPMGRALDQRFASVGNVVGRRVIYEWIAAGCPIPGEPKPQPAQLARPKVEAIRRVIVQEYGLGALH
jgi:hypothetical protein